MSDTESEDEEADRLEGAEALDPRKAIFPTQTVLKILLDKIEDDGGLHVVKLKKICDDNWQLCGKAGTPERRGITHKLSRLKTNKRLYEKELAELGVTPFQDRKKPGLPAEPTQETPTSSSASMPEATPPRPLRSSSRGAATRSQVQHVAAPVANATATATLPDHGKTSECRWFHAVFGTASQPFETSVRR
jgi:hypothetical protein